MNTTPVQFAHHAARRRGFSLVEIMVASFLAMIVTAGVISGFIQYRRSMERQRLLSELHDNVRTAMLYLSRDISMAKYGLEVPDTRLAQWVTWVAGFTTNPKITDGAGTASDTILVGGALEPITRLTAATARGATTITIPETVSSQFNTTDRKLIYIGKCELARITAIAGGQLTVSAHETLNRGLRYAHPTNATVELVKVITYETYNSDYECYLKRLDGDSSSFYWFEDVVCQGIENIQLTRNGSAVHVQVRGRSTERDMTHQDPTFGDNYHRLTLNETVFMRNY